MIQLLCWWVSEGLGVTVLTTVKFCFRFVSQEFELIIIHRAQSGWLWAAVNFRIAINKILLFGASFHFEFSQARRFIVTERTLHIVTFFVGRRKLSKFTVWVRSFHLLKLYNFNLNIETAYGVLGYSYLCICICEYVFVNLYNVYVYLYFCLTPVCVYMLTVRSRNNISVAVLGTRQPPLHHKDKCFVSTAAAKVARKIISEIQLRSYEIWSKGTSGIKKCPVLL